MSQKDGGTLDSSASAKGPDRLRVILLTHGGAEQVLQGLIAVEETEVVGVFMETEITRPRSFRETLKRSIRYDGYAATISKGVRKTIGQKSDEDLLQALESRDELRSIADAQRIPFHLVYNYHHDSSIDLLRSSRPDLGIIYGTNGQRVCV